MLRARRMVGIGLALGLAAGLACGRNRVFLDVDVRSFLDESDLVQTYNAPPLVPATARIQPIPVSLVEGYQDFGAAQSVTIDVGIEYRNVTGTGQGTFTLYLGDDAGTLFSTPPVAALQADLLPGTTSPGAVTIQADQRIIDLFTSRQLFVGADLGWSPSGSEFLQGDCVITQMHARVASQLDLF